MEKVPKRYYEQRNIAILAFVLCTVGQVFHATRLLECGCAWYLASAALPKEVLLLCLAAVIQSTQVEFPYRLLVRFSCNVSAQRLMDKVTCPRFSR